MKKLLILVFSCILVLGVFAFSACIPTPTRMADWRDLHTTAQEWGFEGTLDEFVEILLGEDGSEDDESLMYLSAFEIFIRHYSRFVGSEADWISDLVSGRLHEELPVLCSELEMRIRQDFFDIVINRIHTSQPSDYQFNTISDLFHFDRYYGTYNNVSVFFEWSSRFEDWELIVSGKTFTNKHDSAVFVYYDGLFYYLAEAYERELLTHEDIVVIHSHHRRAERTAESYPVLCDELRERIGFHIGAYYGTFNGASVFGIEGHITAGTRFVFSGLYFSHHHGYELTIWRNGIFYRFPSEFRGEEHGERIYIDERSWWSINIPIIDGTYLIERNHLVVAHRNHRRGVNIPDGYGSAWRALAIRRVNLFQNR